MTISERIFELLEQRGMSQREFSQKTGIAQSSISDWKRRKTNPVSEKILIICSVLGVTPYELLGATEGTGRRSSPSNVLVVEKDSEYGAALTELMALSGDRRGKVLGYLRALTEMQEEESGKSRQDRTQTLMTEGDYRYALSGDQS